MTVIWLVLFKIAWPRPLDTGCILFSICPPSAKHSATTRSALSIPLLCSAFAAALNAFNKELLANHLRTCVAQDIREGHDETIDELVCTLQKLMK